MAIATPSVEGEDFVSTFVAQMATAVGMVSMTVLIKHSNLLQAAITCVWKTKVNKLLLKSTANILKGC